jgi:hypothetical protein
VRVASARGKILSRYDWTLNLDIYENVLCNVPSGAASERSMRTANLQACS